MTVIDLLIQGGLGIVVYLGYSVVGASLVLITAHLVDRLLSTRLAPESAKRKDFELGMFTAMLMALAGLVAFLFTGASEFRWIRFWDYPIVVSLVFTSLMLRSIYTHAFIPSLRRLGVLAYAEAMILVFVVVVGELWGGLLWDSTIRWSIIFVCLLSLTKGTINYMKGVAATYREFTVIQKRINDVMESQERLKQFAFLTGDIQDWREANDAIQGSQSSAQAAQDLLRKDNQNEAGSYVLRAETSVNYYENLVKTRLGVLTETLSVKLDQAKSDLEKLTAQARESVLEEEPFTKLWQEHARLAPIAETLTLADADFSTKIGEVEAFFRDVTQIRTALRFRQNVASTLDELNEELDLAAPEIELATRLEIHAQDVKDTHEKLCQAMNRIRSRQLSSIEEFVSAYKTMQEARGRLKPLLAAVRQTVEVNWISAQPVGDAMMIRVPKIAETDKPANAVVIIENGNGSAQPAELIMRGAGIKAPERLTLQGNGEARVVMRSFGILGERGGRGQLIIDIRSSTGDLLGEHKFHVNVLRTFRETITTAAQYGSVGGAIAGFILWLIGYQLVIAAPAAIILSVIVGIMRFSWARLQLSAIDGFRIPALKAVMR